MKIIITGSCGHIGSYVSENINKISGLKEVVFIDNFLSNRYYSIFNLSNKLKLSFFEMDLSKKGSLDKFKGIILIHCASMTNAENSFSRKKCMKIILIVWRM